MIRRNLIAVFGTAKCLDCGNSTPCPCGEFGWCEVKRDFVELDKMAVDVPCDSFLEE